MIPSILQVALGGAIGAAARYATGLVAARAFGTDFPYGTLAVNGIGSFLMGLGFAALVGPEGEESGLAPLLLVGVLGGYTTFSAYSLEVWQLFTAGRHAAALGYAAGSSVLAIAALAVGVLVAKSALA